MILGKDEWILRRTGERYDNLTEFKCGVNL